MPTLGRRTLWWQAWSWIGEQGCRSWQPVSVDEAGQPRYIKLATRATFSFAVLLIGPKDSTGDSCESVSDGLACFRRRLQKSLLPSSWWRKGSSSNELTRISVG